MFKFILIGAAAWIIGVFGWAQIIGSLQNVDQRKGLLLTMIIWIAIMVAVGYVAVVKLDSTWALAVGYFVSFIQVKGQGIIE